MRNILHDRSQRNRSCFGSYYNKGHGEGKTGRTSIKAEVEVVGGRIRLQVRAETVSRSLSNSTAS